MIFIPALPVSFFFPTIFFLSCLSFLCFYMMIKPMLSPTGFGETWLPSGNSYMLIYLLFEAEVFFCKDTLGDTQGTS